MHKLTILIPLLAAAMLSATGCGGANVLRVNAAKVDATCKRVYFTSVIKQGDAYAEGVPTLVATGADAGVIAIGTSPQIDVSKPVLVTLKVDKSDAGCARFPAGSSWKFDGVLPAPTKSAAGDSVFALDFDSFVAR